ncbi:MAG TPA: pyridoxamine 5'-phosphate oxidase family protein [Candidatus Aphodomorpha intestinavium]|uniref:Pyridoxamine 5'-phosphate oxidase family protein n=1 Tax=Candidatus Aphodomorpha intestinavium TaxID=2840672 RepID=A0A9D1N4L5_9FIRM|nr:pyridoxamine 5'-phosphate oxidase family protein [Candidatus Aphodomorpha intestinavium]
MDIKKLAELMGKYAHGYFATVDEAGFPDLRGWEFQYEKDGRLYFTTSSEKAVYRQMMANPKVAYACQGNGYTVRVSGTAVVVTDAAERAAVYAAMDPGVQALYATPEDGGFTAFYIEHGVAKYAKDGEGFTSFKF